MTMWWPGGRSRGIESSAARNAPSRPMVRTFRAIFTRPGSTADLIDIFHLATRFDGNDFEIVEFCLCFGSEHPNDGPRVTKPTGSSES